MTYKKYAPGELVKEMKEGIREALKDRELTSFRRHMDGNYFIAAKLYSTPKGRCDLKKKFLNGHEALWWAGENFELVQGSARAYKCPICPFWHLSSKNAKKITS